VDCYYDLRAMNSSKGDKFDAFWVELRKYISLDVGEGSHERRAAGSENVSFAPVAISIPSMVREVTKRLQGQPGSEDAPIPSLETVRLQFTPNDPFRLASASSTGILNFRRKIQARGPPPPPPTSMHTSLGGAWEQHGTCAHLRWCAVLAQTRCLRKWHEDSLWCLEHHKYAKQQLVELRDALHAIGRAEVHAVHMDDKCKIPIGLPGLPLAATSRQGGQGGTRGSFVAPGVTLGAADHDFHKQGSITPSVTLLGNIPEEASGSWYAGQLFVDLRDSVYKGSDPMLHMANLLQYLRTHGRANALARQAAWQAQHAVRIEALSAWLEGDEVDMMLELPEDQAYDTVRADKLEERESLQSFLRADRELDDAARVRKWLRVTMLWVTADGGADHNIRHLKVKLSLLALARCTHATKLAALRGCPHQSYAMTCEKAMALLHLGIINVSLARALMAEVFEQMAKNCGSMNDVREVGGMARKGKMAKKGATAKRTGGGPTGAASSAGPDAAADEDEDESGEEAGE